VLLRYEVRIFLAFAWYKNSGILRMSEAIVFERSSTLRTALRLEIITLVWMVIEAAVAVAAGIVARSLVLVAFGIDSAIELVSAIVVFRCFRIELHEESAGALDDARSIERKTARIAGYLLFLLSAYVLVQAGFGLVTRHAAETSPVGIAVAIIAAIGMPFLAKAKLRVADKIDSRALRADAAETLTCGYLAWVLLAALALNSVTHWWWIDAVASLAIVPLLVREGWESALQH
jgi:divalent metal cation (Fe/Co/Zn/Cd) transporter